MCNSNFLSLNRMAYARAKYRGSPGKGGGGVINNNWQSSEGLRTLTAHNQFSDCSRIRTSSLQVAKIAVVRKASDGGFSYRFSLNSAHIFASAKIELCSAWYFLSRHNSDI